MIHRVLTLRHSIIFLTESLFYNTIEKKATSIMKKTSIVKKCLRNVHRQDKVVNHPVNTPVDNNQVVVAVTVVVTNHNDNHQPSLKATAPNCEARSLTAVTTSKPTHLSTH
jgi:hypothetical protein